MNPDWTAVAYPHPFRKHQRLALDAMDAAVAAGSRRAWIVLPPGAGKTLVGLEAARRLGQPIVAFGPNTAIQGQWLAAWRQFTPASIPAGTARDLSAPVTALTYQALATFDPDAEVDEEGHQHLPRITKARRSGSLIDQLHENGRALVRSLEAAGPITLVLDECHHLLEVWGRLLAELLEDLPHAHVIGLTGTPPDTLTSEQAKLVDQLFGQPLYSTSIPSVVREGHLAPFAELAWFTEPTPTESQWLAGEAERFAELRTDLLAPGTASVDFLSWLDQRFVTRRLVATGVATDGSTGDGLAPAEPLAVEWSRLERDTPLLAAAALRFHHAGLLALPDGAVMREQHRREPTSDDWVNLLEGYLTECLQQSADPRDHELVDRIRQALPSIGYQLTKRGIRTGRSPVDRVLARSEAKTNAAVEILAAEADNLGVRLRGLVLCDHERASATLPSRLRGVLDAEAGSARLVLANLLRDARTAALTPVLLTGRVVAADAATARRLVAFVAEHAPHVELDEIPPDAVGTVEVTGRWQSRSWVSLVTRFYEAGNSQVLIGTRALLGEGWDAQGVNTLIDLTTATTPTSVVQTRGRALRVDPSWPEKVADNWTVVCVSEKHPGGVSDWNRFVRKHHGYFGVTDSGEIASGVGHVAPRLSPYAPPPVAEFDAENAMMLERARDRARVRELWQIGTPYRDEVVHAIRVTPKASLPARRLGVAVEPGSAERPSSVPAARAARRAGSPPRAPADWIPAAAIGPAALAIVVLAIVGPWLPIVLPAVAAGVVWWAWLRRRQAAFLAAGRELAALAAPPAPFTFAYAVADAMHAIGLSDRGAAAVSAVVEQDGSYRISLEGASPQVSKLFTSALDEVLSPLGSPKHVVPRYVVSPVPDSEESLRKAGRDWIEDTASANAVVYHAVPALLGSNKDRLWRFVKAWNRWVSDGEAVWTATPEGEGILVTHRGQSPLAATTGMRLAWN